VIPELLKCHSRNDGSRPGLAGLVAGQVGSDVAFQHLLIAMVTTDAAAPAAPTPRRRK
jgi:hypothetical protein